MVTLIPNLRHLRALREVARQGGISAAARELHLSQPAVTQAVAALESGLGSALFERSSRGATLTAPGRLCLARVERALQQLAEGLAEAVRGISDGDSALHNVTAAQLAALVAVVEEGSFGRAARAGGRSRTAVHAATRQLERVLGVSLFEATSHGVQPTREAQRLVRAARLAAAEIAQARGEVAATTGVDRGCTVIGAMPLARSIIVPTAIVRFAASRPRHAIAVLDGPYESMLDALRRGVADVLIGALRDASPADVRQEHLFDDPLAIVVRAGHPLVALTSGARRAPPIAALARYPWIAARPGSPLRRQFDRLLAAIADDGPAAPIECNSLVAARGLLIASDRAMLLSAHQVRFELHTGQLVALPHPFGPVSRAIGLTVRRDWRPTAAQHELLSLIRESCRECAADPPPIRAARGRAGRGRRAAKRPSAAERND
jgi:LysR family transcriptional regulator of gallate degradation